MVIGFITRTLAITYNRPLSTIIYTLLILMINLKYYNYYSLTATTISQMNYTHGIELQKGCAFTPHHRTQLCCRYTAHTYLCQVNALCGVGGWLLHSDGSHFHSCSRQSTWDWMEVNPINRAGVLALCDRSTLYTWNWPSATILKCTLWVSSNLGSIPDSSKILERQLRTASYYRRHWTLSSCAPPHSTNTGVQWSGGHSLACPSPSIHSAHPYHLHSPV